MEPLPRIAKSGTRRAAFWGLLAVTVLIDLLTKYWAFAQLTEPGQTWWWLKPYGGFIRRTNPGAAFSLLGSVPYSRILLSLIAIALLGMLFRMAQQAAFERVWWALAILSGGALANLYDRVYYGHVRDFIKIGLPEYGYWPTFNIADMAISGGVIILIIHLMQTDRDTKKPVASSS